MPALSIIKQLQSLPLFSQLEVEEIRTLIEHSPNRSRQYGKGEWIALQGEAIRSLPILLAGQVRAQMTSPEGKRLTMDLISAPELLASAFVYSTQGRYPVSIEAMEDCELWHLDKEYFLGYMSRYPSVMRAFLGLISDRCNFLSQKLNALGLQSLRERLLNYLSTHGSLGKQEELALLLGVARPSLARLLADLVDEGILYKEGQNYRLTTKLQ